MNITLDKKFTSKFAKQITGFDMRAGVLLDSPHYWASYGPTNHLAKKVPAKVLDYAGGPRRGIYRGSYRGRPYSDDSTAHVLVSLMRRIGRNILTEPFKNRNSAIIQFMNGFLKMAFAQGSPRRVENLLQAVIRNPILEQKYGHNSAKRAKIKGFDRFLIDTSQVFKSLIAKVKRV